MYNNVKQNTPKCVENKDAQRVIKPWENDVKGKYNELKSE